MLWNRRGNQFQTSFDKFRHVQTSSDIETWKSDNILDKINVDFPNGQIFINGKAKVVHYDTYTYIITNPIYPF